MSSAESLAGDRRTILGSCTEEKQSRSPAVVAQNPQKKRPTGHLRFPTKSHEIASHLLPRISPVGSAKTPQIVKSSQHRMPTPKPLQDSHQPEGNEPGRHLAVRIHRHHGAKEAPLSHLPTSKTQKQRPNHRTHRVLKVRNQLDRKQRKSHSPPTAQKARNGNPLLLEAGKELNGIAPIGGNLSVAMGITTDGTGRSNKGEKIDLTLQKRFLVFPNRLESVNVGKLNSSAALPTGLAGLWSAQTFGPASSEGLVIFTRSIPYLAIPSTVISSVQLPCKYHLLLKSLYRGK